MRIALFCATRRGLLFLQKLRALAPAADLVVCSFREEAHEPPFLEEIRRATEGFGGRFFEVRRGSAAEVAEALANGFDLLFAVSWRYLIPPAVYKWAAVGSYAMHDSMLPRYRGFSPTVWAMIDGEEATGATLFEMTERADEGAIVDQERVAILPSDTIAEVMERVTAAYLLLLERNIGALMAGRAVGREQDHSAASYCRKRRVEDNLIRWDRTTRELLNLIRATTRPYPGAFTMVRGDWCAEGSDSAGVGVENQMRKLTVWSAMESVARVEHVKHAPGSVVEVVKSGCTVLTGDGALRVLEAQWEGEAARPATEIIGRLGMTLG